MRIDCPSQAKKKEQTVSGNRSRNLCVQTGFCGISNAVRRGFFGTLLEPLGKQRSGCSLGVAMGTRKQTLCVGRTAFQSSINFLYALPTGRIRRPYGRSRL